MVLPVFVGQLKMKKINLLSVHRAKLMFK
jgi:hypothetical protein